MAQAMVYDGIHGDSVEFDCDGSWSYSYVARNNVREPGQDHLGLGSIRRGDILRGEAGMDRPRPTVDLESWADNGYPNGDYQASDWTLCNSGEGVQWLGL